MVKRFQLEIFGLSQELRLAPGLTNVQELRGVTGVETETDPLGDKDRKYFNLKRDGVSFLSRQDVIDSIFLYIKIDEVGRFPFIGSINLLPLEFFSNPNKEDFEIHLDKIGFTRLWRDYPYSLNMISENIRINYYSRPDLAYIYIDDGHCLPKRKAD